MSDDMYPTEEDLEYIRKFDVLKTINGDDPNKNFAMLMDYVRALWHWPTFFTEEGGLYRLATGGWSGNEDLLEALRENNMAHVLFWESSHRGGLVYYRKNYQTGNVEIL